MSLVRFCRHLTLEGWEHLEAAQAEGRGVLALFPPVGLAEIAPLPLGVYGGPLQVWGEALLDALPRCVRERFRLEEVADAEAARRGLAAGGRVGLPWGPEEERRRAAELARETGAPALPVVCRPEPAGCWRLVVEPPATPEALASPTSVSGASPQPPPAHRK
jgi:lauroyl/myristoyl acyltransferase